MPETTDGPRTLAAETLKTTDELNNYAMEIEKVMHSIRDKYGTLIRIGFNKNEKKERFLELIRQTTAQMKETHERLQQTDKNLAQFIEYFDPDYGQPQDQDGDSD